MTLCLARNAWTFDEFLERWLDTEDDELVIAENGDRYVVEDTRVGGESTYTRRSLLNLWSEAGR